MQVPVALIIFNRPDTTEKVFAEIAKARPEKLLVLPDVPLPEFLVSFHASGEFALFESMSRIT